MPGPLVVAVVGAGMFCFFGGRATVLLPGSLRGSRFLRRLGMNLFVRDPRRRHCLLSFLVRFDKQFGKHHDCWVALLGFRYSTIRVDGEREFSQITSN